ncbi:MULTISPECIES: DUF5054 domain-containing protein [Paenibacillus]|uniref:DUF5054 domain-containing protein n=1 Tax=Paenibacillus albilobatus TaxID=2716884 RepID=A0A919XDV0_9BACL|nr:MULTISPECIES: DUF5054 domain-containing protein [Paenibacillus]GIO29603.1 hypothetical protein J2TS6_07440 [Paenibacillus albilobatus]
MSGIQTVHVVFKTHLDIGFTDMAQNVIDQYFKSYIPNAIRLAEQLRLEGGPAQFVWTTGSWLIHEYLKQAGEQQRRNMENAIAAGSIVWHGLPFTTHTELMDPALFEYGLSIAQKLNAQYGESTMTAKMTDVPGHTIAMVPLLAKYGIRYLHLGVNPASKVPNVPEIFVWRAPDGSEVVVNYANNYGDTVQIDGFDEAMVFAHTGDNCGPPTKEDIQAEFDQLSEKFPGALIRASTMEAFASKLVTLKDRFPVVEEEIGDTWIHGAASDPGKLQQYREMLKLRDRWTAEGRFDPASKEYADFCDKLLLIPEHTWGLDEKKFLPDFKHYSLRDFQAARQADTVSKDAIPDKYRYMGSFAMNEHDRLSSELFALSGRRSFRLFESSWQEQRGYIRQAIQCLSEDKRLEAAAAIQALAAVPEECKDGHSLNPGRPHSLGLFKVEFDTDGSICKLVDRRGKVWADESHRLGRFVYETFGLENYHHWFEHYVEQWSKTYHWADADFGKPGMEFAEPRPEYRQISPNLICITSCSREIYDLVHVRLAMPSECVQVHGAPREIRIDYRFHRYQQKIDIDISWFNKQANRLPEACWFTFALKVDNPNLWKMDKMGMRISPLEVVKNGNRNLHAVNAGVNYRGSDGEAMIETLDAPLVAPGEKRLLQFDHTFVSLDGGMHFLLYNNVWGTNFPMWYEENAIFRFVISLD